jgi:hypothetical protein
LAAAVEWFGCPSQSSNVTVMGGSFGVLEGDSERDPVSARRAFEATVASWRVRLEEASGGEFREVSAKQYFL